ncbi:hypothetical protein V7T09_08835 [Segatella copri]|uniref:hypothetical protein n=1 Tax=Segatella copri TaxID=165179 RepID=UPI001C48D03F|nr:hypothetical protein [Segatella copri]MBW0021790.1 hypothetical protein [Segatella copri]
MVQVRAEGPKAPEAARLKGQKPKSSRSSTPERAEDQKLQKQHALKGQKLLAQGIALGMMAISKTPCKGKSFMSCLEF